MIRRWLALFALASLMMMTGCTATGSTANSHAYHFRSATAKGQLIPVTERRLAGPLVGALIGGGTYRLTSKAGKVVVVNFWATWCGPCQTETPQLDHLYRQVDQADVTFVGIDTMDVSRQAPEAFIADNHISYPIVFDEAAAAARKLGDIPTGGLPFTVLIDKQQRVAAVYLGPVTPTDLKQSIDTLVSEQ